MLKPFAFANAFTAVGLLLYVVCRILSLLVPDVLYIVGQSWFHTFSLGSSKTVAPLEIGTFVFGGISLALLVWVSAFAVAWFYNRWPK